MPNPLNNILTVQGIANHFGQRATTARYAMLVHGPPPAGMVGGARVWTRDDLPAIEEAIDTTIANRRRPLEVG